ncbi:hypothetical protein EB796_023148 [Bugula neritina]|uniref:Uncharacterized protein n=1 Tax=Bugula neritina TaxID=10212 RepID=A0A7J7IYB2_BUGNE|nr:hypothetical protein EB796_023148 [Bugula neritina]
MLKDLNALLDVLNGACNNYSYITYYDYNPGVSTTTGNDRYWPAIEEALARVRYETTTTVKISNYGHMTEDNHTLSCSSHQQFHPPFITHRSNTEGPCYLITDNALYYGSCYWTGNYFTHSRLSISVVIARTEATELGMSQNISHTHESSDAVLWSQFLDHFIQTTG